jgi:ribonuclease T2
VDVLFLLYFVLHDVGIKPDDKFYEMKDIENTIKQVVGFAPGIECNKDSSHNSQLYQIYLCVDTSASKFINCPVMPHGRCDSRVQFPKF